MKKVLIITHLDHANPRVSVGLCKYLPEFGWEPAVLTPESRTQAPPGTKVIATPGYRSPYNEPMKLTSKKYRRIRPYLKHLYRLYKEFAFYPDEEAPWKIPALEDARQLVQTETFDAIMSSSSPVTSHIIARELHERHGIPWVADLRDLWSQNHNYQYSGIRRWFERRLELETLSEASALVTVTGPWAVKLSQLHSKPAACIPNGFDPDDFIGTVPLTKQFTITYTGQIYKGKQDPTKFFRAVESLPDRKSVAVRLYGTTLDNRIPRSSAIMRQRESQVLLFFNWEDPNEKGVLPCKLFEYLASGRPILATGGYGGDAVESLLVETGAGVYARTEEEIRDALVGFYGEYSRSGRVGYGGRPNVIARYSHREMARKFAEVLEGVVRR